MEPDYGLSSRAVSRTSRVEPRFIRITDFGEDGIDAGHSFMTPEDVQDGYELALNDMLFARSGSVGKTYIHEDVSEPAVFAGYCIRFRFGTSEVLPRFVYWWSKTDAYLRWVAATQRPSVQANINKQEFKDCLIPLPPLGLQNELIAAMDAARAERKAKLAEADTLLASLDDFVLNALGITPQKDERRVFAIRRGDIKASSLSPARYSPDLQAFLNALRGHPSASQELGACVALNPKVDVSAIGDDEAVGFIPMDVISDGATGEYTSEARTLAEVRKGYTPFADGDILWAKITPCMQNGKVCIVEGMPHRIGFGSTEFHVLRVLDPGVLTEFVREFVSQRSLRRVATYAFTGSAGQQRVPAEFLATLPLPKPPMSEQIQIVREIESIRSRARALRVEAENKWQEAKRWFEEQLLGPSVQ